MSQPLNITKSPAPKESPLRRWLALAWGGCTIGLWVAAAMDVTLRDRVPGLAAVFYAMPPIVLGVLLLLMAGLGGCPPLAVLLKFQISDFTLKKRDGRGRPSYSRRRCSVASVWACGCFKTFGGHPCNILRRMR